MTKHPDHISASKFLDELRRYQKGSVSRRPFLVRTRGHPARLGHPPTRRVGFLCCGFALMTT